MNLGIFVILIIIGVIALISVIVGIYSIILTEQQTKISKIGLKILLGYWGYIYVDFNRFYLEIWIRSGVEKFEVILSKILKSLNREYSVKG